MSPCLFDIIKHYRIFNLFPTVPVGGIRHLKREGVLWCEWYEVYFSQQYVLFNG